MLLTSNTNRLRLVIFVFTCFNLNSYPYKFTKIIEKEIDSIVCNLQQKKGTRVGGISVPTRYGFTTVRLLMNSEKSVALNEARKNFLEIADSLIESINRSAILRPLLHKYPFELSDLELSLYFDDLNDNPDAVWVVHHLSNTPHLRYKAPLRGKDRADLILSETIDKALSLVKDTLPSELKN